MAGLSIKLVAVLIVATVSGCASQTVFEQLASNPDFSTLVQLISVANLTDYLSDPNLSAVILAPTNAAIANTTKTFPDLKAATTDQFLAQSILYYHVLGAGLAISDGLTVPTTLSSYVNETFQANTLSNLTFRVTPDNTTYLAGRSPGALLSKDGPTQVGQSTIYTITENFLIPPSKDIRVVKNTTEYLSIAEALQGSGNETEDKSLSQLLELVSADPELLAVATNPDTVITIFAPTNEALTRYLASQQVTLQDIKGKPEATYLLKNHIVGARAYSALALAGGRTVLPTLNPNETVTVVYTKANSGNPLQVGNGNFTSEGDSADFVGSNLKSVNLAGGKSVIHSIDEVLAPQNTNTTTGTGITAPPGAGANSTSPPTGTNSTSPPGGGGVVGGGVVGGTGNSTTPPSPTTGGETSTEESTPPIVGGGVVGGIGNGTTPPAPTTGNSTTPPGGVGVGGIGGNTTTPPGDEESSFESSSGGDTPPVGGIVGGTLNGTMPPTDMNSTMPPTDMNTTMPPGSDGGMSPPVGPNGGGIGSGGIVDSGLSPPLGSPRGLTPPPPGGGSPATMVQFSAWFLSMVLGTAMLIAFTTM